MVLDGIIHALCNVHKPSKQTSFTRTHRTTRIVCVAYTQKKWLLVGLLSCSCRGCYAIFEVFFVSKSKAKSITAHIFFLMFTYICSIWKSIKMLKIFQEYRKEQEKKKIKTIFFFLCFAGDVCLTHILHKRSQSILLLMYYLLMHAQDARRARTMEMDIFFSLLCCNVPFWRTSEIRIWLGLGERGAERSGTQLCAVRCVMCVLCVLRVC